MGCVNGMCGLWSVWVMVCVGYGMCGLWAVLMVCVGYGLYG